VSVPDAANGFAAPLPGYERTRIHSLTAAQSAGLGEIARLPFATRALLENVLRHASKDPAAGRQAMVALVDRAHGRPIPFYPDRVLMQDASGIPALADAVAVMETKSGLGSRLGLARAVDLVVDHAVEMDHTGFVGSAADNLDIEYARNAGRFRFLRWMQDRVDGLRVIPPGLGICHQLNLEVLANIVRTDDDDHGGLVARLDSIVGTDSHTTMINGLGVVGWGVGGVEATAAVLGEPLVIPVPRVIGVHLSGCMRPGTFATDLALRLAARLRDVGVVDQVVEFFGPGVATLTVPDRATVANMAPEFGATMAYFPADIRALEYLRSSGRNPAAVRLTEDYVRAQQLLSDTAPQPFYDTQIELDLSAVAPTVAGPSRPHDVWSLDELAAGVDPTAPADMLSIASITSCTNTSNPRAMIAAGLLAQKADRLGLRPPLEVKTSMSLGSRAVERLLSTTGLQTHLDRLGFAVAGFGCGTCMGNSGPLTPQAQARAAGGAVTTSAVLSGNRNFPGRIHPDVTEAYLTAPALVVAFALAGTMRTDLTRHPLGIRPDGTSVELNDIWPTEQEIDALIKTGDSSRIPSALNTARWDQLERPAADVYQWDSEAGNIRKPPFLDPELTEPNTHDLVGAQVLMLLGDGVTTDHISPVSRIRATSHAGRWLREHGVEPQDMGTFASRRLNHDVMMRGGFDNLALQNLMVDRPGAWARADDGTIAPLHEVASANISLLGWPR